MGNFYVECETVQINIPQKVIVVETLLRNPYSDLRTMRFYGESRQILAKRLGTIQQTRRCDTIPQNARLCFKEPLKRVAISKYIPTIDK